MKSLLVFVLCLVLFSSISSIFQKNLKSLNEKSEKKDGDASGNSSTTSTTSSTTSSSQQTTQVQPNCESDQTTDEQKGGVCACTAGNTTTSQRTAQCYTQNTDGTFAYHATYTLPTTTPTSSTIGKKQSNKESSAPKVARISTTSN